MKKEANQYILIGEIVLILAIVGSLSYFAWSFFKRQREKKEREGAEQLSGNDALISGASKTSEIIKKIKNKDEQQKSIKDFPALEVVEMIKNAKGIVDDDEQSVYNAFAKIKNVIQLNLVTNLFKRIYNIELFTFLNSFLNAEELKKINDIVKKLK